ncbi:glycosyltransferase [Thalassovita sp.]|jgi:hypothetical protein|uniref:glycosyltransferase n=1 Tax=Thalassovita sp. TaxID=1979401 RepID=UPI002AAFE5FE|nr:glycosyltransferase [Thalassovita sp.]
MHLLYLMRYSFYGQSGWRGEASRDPEKLFSPERLEQREYYLRKVALPSLRDQTDQDFNLIVLSSTLMPKPYQDRLKEVCNDMLGPRAHVIFREPDSTSKVFQKYRWQTFNRYAHTAQIVLDDDDAVGVDFTADLRGEANAAVALRKANQPNYVFLSWPRGVTALFEDGNLELIPRNVPATNLGLTVVAPSESHRSPFRVAHHKVLERRPVRVIHTLEPQYIRSVHASNDSKGRRGTEPVKAETLPMLFKTFPLLRDLKADWKMRPEMAALAEA